MEYLGYILLIVVLITIGVSKMKEIADKEEPEKEEKITAEVLPYKKKLLLTKNEWIFYKSLKPVADELGFSILSKIRVADLVEVNVDDKKDYMKYFNKINKKHVDFALAKPDNLQIMLLIELDDNSHKDGNKRDEFIEKLYKQTGYKLLRLKGEAGLKEAIENALK